jgi:hypothetical protein
MTANLAKYRVYKKWLNVEHYIVHKLQCEFWVMDDQKERPLIKEMR